MPRRRRRAPLYVAAAVAFALCPSGASAVGSPAESAPSTGASGATARSGLRPASSDVAVPFVRESARGLARRSRTPQKPTPGPASGRVVDFAPTSFYYDDISRAPLDPDSAGIAANVAAQVANHWGGVAAFNAHQWNATFYRVDRATPAVTVKWNNCFKWDWTPADLFGGAKHFVDVRIPALAQAAQGSDGTMAIYDADTDTLWEFWQMRKDATGSWSACWGGRIDDVSRSNGQHAARYGVAASGLAIAGGLISAAEVRRGQIDHAMYLGVIEARYFTELSWPATRSDGYTKNPYTPMEGQRLRLDPSLDVDSLRLSRFATMVAKAAQKYGFIVSDKGGAVALIGEAGQSLAATTGTNPWPELLREADHAVLKGFPWNRLQALPRDYGKR